MDGIGKGGEWMEGWGWDKGGEWIKGWGWDRVEGDVRIPFKR